MVYNNANQNDLPDIVQLRDWLMGVLQKFPVIHRKPYEKEVLDDRKYIVTPLVSGRYSLKPNITRQGLLFHGSNRFYENFVPRLYQNSNPNHLFVNVQREALLITMESHPIYRLLMDGIIFPNGRRFIVHNPYGLVACYGHRTPFIQLTSDLDTAIMYAITANMDNGRRRYLNSHDSQTGVLYVFELRSIFGMIPGLSTLGLQAFDRPGRLKEFLFQMNPNTNFNDMPNVKGFVFRHDFAVERDLLMQIRRPRLTDLLSSKMNNLFQRQGNQLQLPIEALHRNTQVNHLTMANEQANKDKLKEMISFDADLSDYLFNENDFADTCFVSQWHQLCDKLHPIIPSDQFLIDALRRVPEEPQYSVFFNKEQWLEYLRTRR